VVPFVVNVCYQIQKKLKQYHIQESNLNFCFICIKVQFKMNMNVTKMLQSAKMGCLWGDFKG
jgi:hypothetical protein